MAKQEDIESMEREILTQRQTIDELAKIVTTLEKQNKERGKALNKLWEKGKELKKEVATIQKYCGKLTFDLAKLELENKIIVIPANKQIGCEPKQFLVRDIVRQLINESGYDLEFKVLQKKLFGPVNLTITGKEIKK